MFKIEVLVAGRWTTVGGRFATREEAQCKVVVFMAADAKKRRRCYRVSEVGLAPTQIVAGGLEPFKGSK